MNYYLIQGNDINHPIEFNKVSGFEELDINKIESIDKFTGSFKCYSDLKNILDSCKLLKNNDRLNVKYNYKGTINPIKYGIVFNDKIVFLDYHNIIAFLYKNKKSLELMNAILNKETNEYKPFWALYKLKNYISCLSKNQASLDDESQIMDEFKYFFEAYVDYKVKHKNNKGKNIIRYTDLRKLGLFLAELADKYSLDISDMKLNNDSIIYTNNHKVDSPKVKKKTKKKQVDGQYTLPGFEDLV